MNKFLLLICLAIIGCSAKENNQYDVIIIGGSASGTTAGIQAARLGCKTLIIEESSWLGGMLTSAGVSAVDGNYNLPSGLWGEFKDHLCHYYGSLDSLKTGWVSNVLFEPSVGNKILNQMAAKERLLHLMFNSRWMDVKKEHSYWNVRVRDNSGKDCFFRSKFLIDATELGDVSKACGVKYDVGMENRLKTGEPIGVESSNDVVQDLTYVATLKDYGRDALIPKPQGYAPEKFKNCCLRDGEPKDPKTEKVWNAKEMLNYGKLPNKKYMINWPLHGNDYYLNVIEMTREDREKALQEAKQHTLCFIYYLQNELGYKHLGLADDEYPTQDQLPFIPYYRESRRIHGKVRFTLNDVKNPYTQSLPLYRTAIAVGDYPVDHHHKCYNGALNIPKLPYYPIPSYSLPIGVLIPQGVDNLIVAEKSISVSNIINGTTRLQPVVMQIGQAAGTIVAEALSENKNVSNVNIRKTQDKILESGGYLMPYLDINKSDKRFKVLQRIGCTGIMKGVGKNVDWSNQTWFRINDNLKFSDLFGLSEYYKKELKDFVFTDSEVATQDAVHLLSVIKKRPITLKMVQSILSEYGYKSKAEKNISRGEMAILIDQLLDPFHQFNVDFTGRLIK